MQSHDKLACIPFLEEVAPNFARSKVLMKNIFKFISVALIVLGLVYFINSKRDTSSQEVKPTLRLGISADNPPFTFVRDGAFVGFEIDLAHALASQMGYNLEILDLDFGGLIPAVKNDVIDLSISGFNITEERKKNVDFSDPYYFGETGVVAHKAITSADDLADCRIGVQHGSIWEDEAKSIAATRDGVEVVGFHRINQIVQELEQKSIDAIVIEKTVAEQILNSHPHFKVSSIPSSSAQAGLGVVLRPGSELLKPINNALSEIKRNGTLKKIAEKWFTTT